MGYSIIIGIFLFTSCAQHLEQKAAPGKGEEGKKSTSIAEPRAPINLLDDTGLIEPFAPFWPYLGHGGGAKKIGFQEASQCAIIICKDTGCVTRFRSQGIPCGNKKIDVCDKDDACDGNGNCVDLKSNALCSEAKSICDPEDFCNGIDNFCPDTKTTAGVKCGEEVDFAAFPCDRVNECDGQGNCVDLVHQSYKICESGVESECNPLDHCDGIHKTCPNIFAAAGKSCNKEASFERCDLPDECDGQGHCIDQKALAGTVCEHAHDLCRPDAECDGVSPFCPETFAPVGTPCGALLLGTCDAEGLCRDNAQELVTDNCPAGTGSDPDNDQDTYSTACDCNDNDPTVYLGTPCSPASACFEDICTQESSNPPSCEPVNFANGTGCQNNNSNDPCAEGGYCSSGTCLTSISPSGTVCRASSDDCDETEFCDGVSTSCPSDALDPSGTPCGDMENNFCIAAQTCSGQSASCSAAVTYIDGIPSSSTASDCSGDTSKSICSVGVDYCMNPDLTNATNNPKTVLFGDEGVASPQFGISVSMHGDYAVVGEPGSAQLGTVFVYHFASPNTAVPTLIATIYSPGTDPQGNHVVEQFGTSVSLYNNRFAVGAPFADGYYDRNTADSDCDMGDKLQDVGAVYMYRINGDNTVTLEERLQGGNIGFPADQENNCDLEVGQDDLPGSDSNFGYDVALSDSYMVAGGPHNTNDTTGFIYVYTRNNEDWGSPQLIGSSVFDGGAQFGFSVAISPDGNKIAIGAPFHDTDHDNNGNFQTYVRQGTVFTGPQYNQTGLNGGDRLGYDVSITNTLLAVGVPQYNDRGGVYLFQVLDDATLGLDSFIDPIDSETDDQFFGASVSLDRSHNGHGLLIGAPTYAIQQGGGVGGSNYQYGYFAYFSVTQSLSNVVPADFVRLSAQSGYSYNVFNNNQSVSCQQELQLGNSLANDSNRIAIGALGYTATNAGSCALSGSAGFSNPVGAVSFQFFPY